MFVDRVIVLTGLGEVKWDDERSMRTHFARLLVGSSRVRTLIDGTQGILIKGSSYTVDDRDPSSVVRSLLVGCNAKASEYALNVLSTPFFEKTFSHGGRGTYSSHNGVGVGVVTGLIQAVNSLDVGGAGNKALPIQEKLPSFLEKFLKTQAHTHMVHVAQSAEDLRYGPYDKALNALREAMATYGKGPSDEVHVVRLNQLADLQVVLAAHEAEVDRQVRAVVSPSCYKPVDWGKTATAILQGYVGGVSSRLDASSLLAARITRVAA